jgi:hypothetical protein
VNGCAQPVTIRSATLSASAEFSLVSGSAPQTVAAGGASTPFEIGFKPVAAGSYSGGFLVQTDLQPTPFGAQMTGHAVEGYSQTDIFAGGPTAFPLSGTPDPTTIMVYVNGPPQMGVNFPATDPMSGVVYWTYDALSNAVVPNPLTFNLATTDTLYVEYTLVCD